MSGSWIGVGLLGLWVSLTPAVPAQPATAALGSSARELLSELVAIDTAEPDGNTTAAADIPVGDSTHF